mgnify:CR=1 FL=1
MTYTESETPTILNTGGGGFGYGGDSWVLIILFALIFGWGNNGFGGSGGGNYVLQTDFATIERKIDGVNHGICSLGYEQLGQMNGINTNIFQSTYALRDAIGQSIQTSNANTQRILDYLTSEKMAEQQAKINKLELSESQAMQNAYLINALRPSPIPAYQVQNPYCCQMGCGASIQ